MTFRIASASFALLFAFGAVVQWNDPDPLRWMAAYAAVALLSAAAAWGRLSALPTALLLAVLVAWVGLWAPALRDSSLDALRSYEMSGVAEERVREVWGLILLSAWTSVLLVVAWRRRSGKQQR